MSVSMPGSSPPSPTSEGSNSSAKGGTSEGSKTSSFVEQLSQLSGLSVAEIAWTCRRMVALLHEGKTREEAKAVIRAEQKLEPKPWETESAK